MKKIILIGGAPTTGKTVAAKLLSQKLNLPWISTDQIRTMLKSVANSEKYPTLFDTQNLTAEKFLTTFTPEEIVTKEFDQAYDVWPGIYALITKDCTWQEGFIVEGVNIIPELVRRDLSKNKNITSLFLIDEDFDRMRDVIYNRGLYDDAHTYSDDVKDIEVEWVMLFAKRLKREASKYNYPLIEVTKNNNQLFKALKKYLVL